eukprot:5472920-Amphidinium_carterae.2
MPCTEWRADMEGEVTSVLGYVRNWGPPPLGKDKYHYIQLALVCKSLLQQSEICSKSCLKIPSQQFAASNSD